MTNLVSFGLSCRSHSWTSSEHVTLLPARTHLFRPNFGPAGLLLRRISSLQEAISVGGLMLVSLSDNRKWWFAAGRQLEYMAAHNRIGKRPKTVYTKWGRAYDLKHDPRRDGIVVEKGKSQGWETERKVRRYTRGYGGDLYVRLDLGDHFEQSEDVACYGIVTGATEGAGFSSSAAVSRSFMATHVPMSTQLGNFLLKTKDVLLSGTPADLRGYYADVYDDCVATFPGSAVSPTIATTTVWSGTNEVQPEAWRPNEVAHTGLAPGAVSKFTTDGYDLPTWRTILSGLRTYDPSNEGYATAYDEVMEKSSAYLDTENINMRPHQFRVMNRAGHYAGGLGTYSGLMYEGDAMPSVPMALQTGVIERLNVGLLRDAHVLGRSLVDGQRYAVDTPSHATVLDLILETMDTQLFPAGLNPGSFEESLAGLEAMADASLQNGSGSVGDPSMYQRGNLVTLVTRFHDLLDARAKARAKQGY